MPFMGPEKAIPLKRQGGPMADILTGHTAPYIEVRTEAKDMWSCVVSPVKLEVVQPHNDMHSTVILTLTLTLTLIGGPAG